MIRSGLIQSALPFVACAGALTVCVLVLYLPVPDEVAEAPPPELPRQTSQPYLEPAGRIRVIVPEGWSPLGMPAYQAQVEISWDAQEVPGPGLPRRLPRKFVEPVTDFADVILWQIFVGYWDKHNLREGHKLTAAELRQIHDQAEATIQSSIKAQYGIVTRVRVAEPE